MTQQRPISCQENADFQQSVENVLVEAAGVMELTIVLPSDLLEISVKAYLGDKNSLHLLMALNNTLNRIGKAPRNKSILCISCSRHLLRCRFSFGVSIPHCNTPMHALVQAVCYHCASDTSEIKDKLVAGLKNIWPDIKAIKITHPNGGAA